MCSLTVDAGSRPHGNPRGLGFVTRSGWVQRQVLNERERERERDWKKKQEQERI